MAGVFTGGSLEQLRSHGFRLLYIPYDSVCDAFQVAGIDAAYTTETSRESFRNKVMQFEALDRRAKDEIGLHLRRTHESDLKTFFDALGATLRRTVESVSVLPLYGAPQVFCSFEEAVAFIGDHAGPQPETILDRYEVVVRYSNGDEVRDVFGDEETVQRFLRGLGS